MPNYARSYAGNEFVKHVNVQVSTNVRNVKQGMKEPFRVIKFPDNMRFKMMALQKLLQTILHGEMHFLLVIDVMLSFSRLSNQIKFIYAARGKVSTQSSS